MSTAPVPVAKVSWLKKFGQDVLKVLGFVAKEAAPIAESAGAVVSILFPAFAPAIAAGENLVANIANQASVTEAAYNAVGSGANGPAKLQAVLNAVGPEIDAWVQAAFPGAAQVSAIAKAGLVDAVVAILNDIDANLALTTPTAAAVAAASAAGSAIATATAKS